MRISLCILWNPRISSLSTRFHSKSSIFVSQMWTQIVCFFPRFRGQQWSEFTWFFICLILNNCQSGIWICICFSLYLLKRYSQFTIQICLHLSVSKTVYLYTCIPYNWIFLEYPEYLYISIHPQNVQNIHWNPRISLTFLQISVNPINLWYFKFLNCSHFS